MKGRRLAMLTCFLLNVVCPASDDNVVTAGDLVNMTSDWSTGVFPDTLLLEFNSLLSVVV